MKKQLLLFVMMLLPMLVWGDNVKIDGIWYNLVSKTKEAKVTKNPSGFYSGAIVIPEKVSYGDTEYSVTSIESEAFKNCTSLTSVTIGDNVTNMGIFTFYGCKSLTSATIGNGVKTIELNTFQNCSRLTSVTIGNNVTTIRDYAFSGCVSLTSITIPNSVTEIGYDVFEDCARLTSITIPNSVTCIRSNPFERCSSLTSINVDEGNTTYDSRENCNAIIETSSKSLIVGCKNSTIPNSVKEINVAAFYGCSGLISITIPDSVYTIGASAFRECSRLVSVTIGKRISEIKDFAFRDCPELTDVTILGKGVPSTHYQAFLDSYIEYATLHVPETEIDKYKAKEPWKNFKSIVGIESGITQVRANAVLVQSESGRITVNGVDDGTKISIYSSNGVLNGTAICRNGSVAINTSLQVGSVAIVKIGERSVKVVTK